MMREQISYSDRVGIGHGYLGCGLYIITYFKFRSNVLGSLMPVRKMSLRQMLPVDATFGWVEHRPMRESRAYRRDSIDNEVDNGSWCCNCCCTSLVTGAPDHTRAFSLEYMEVIAR